jgi:hypothetical protein
VTSPLPAKIWQHRIQPTAPAAPISTGTGTIRDYFLVCAIPKAVLDGRASLEETKMFEIVEAPEVEIQLSTTPRQ